MEIPGLGKVNFDDDFGLYSSEPIIVPVLGGKKCHFGIEDYENDPDVDEIHSAIANFLRIGPSVLKDSEQDVYRYYQKCNSNWDADDPEFLTIESPSDVWNYIQIGDEPVVLGARLGTG